MSKEIKNCPKECLFDWIDFHKKLDIAIAHIIDEQDKLPSNTSLLEMIQYSFEKQKLQKIGEKN